MFNSFDSYDYKISIELFSVEGAHMLLNFRTSMKACFSCPEEALCTLDLVE